MTFLITYHTLSSYSSAAPLAAQGELETTEWITPAGWSWWQAVDSFQRQHPSARVTSCEALYLAEAA